jgi:hypothetical protein
MTMKKITMNLALITVAAIAAGQIGFRAYHDKAVERIVNQENQIDSSALPRSVKAMAGSSCCLAKRTIAAGERVESRNV